MTYKNPEALVTTEWLAQNLDDSGIRTVEVDEDFEAYRSSHIPGSIAWNWQEDLHDGVRRDYIDQDRLRELLEASGVGDDITVVLYSGNNNWFAAYAYWLCKYRGFDNVRLLDGGRMKWAQEGRPMTTDVPAISRARLTALKPQRPELRALRDDVLAKLGEATFIDVRSPEEFSGEKLAPDHLPQEQPYVGGHVPGALNIPWSTAANEDGSFKSADELRQIYAAAANGEVIAYCRIGERSSHTWFVLHELLGMEGVSNYDGSWTEYGSLVDVPVER